MKLFTILFILLGAVELLLKPRLYCLDEHYIIWYGSSNRRRFIMFPKIF
jgi:hypothetical protein